MGTTVNKLNKILDSKAKIKAALEAKGVQNIGDKLSDYPSKIESIKTSVDLKEIEDMLWSAYSTPHTGNVDRAGLKEIGWTDEDIDFYQKFGVTWDANEDDQHKVPQSDKDIYKIKDTINELNFYEICNNITYLPKLSNINWFIQFTNFTNLITIPKLDLSYISGNIERMFEGCSSLVCLPDTFEMVLTEDFLKGCNKIQRIPIVIGPMFGSMLSSSNLKYLIVDNSPETIFEAIESNHLPDSIEIVYGVVRLYASQDYYNFSDNLKSIKINLMSSSHNPSTISFGKNISVDSIIYLLQHVKENDNRIEINIRENKHILNNSKVQQLLKDHPNITLT